MSEFPYKIGGAIPSPVDPRDYVYGISEAVLPAEYLPEVKAAVHNQGQINNCATHALTACLENELGGSLAFNWYYGNRRYSDHKGQGTVERDLLKTAQKDGCLVWQKYPYQEEMPSAMERFEAAADPLLPEARNLNIGSYWALTGFDGVCQALVDGKFVQLGLQLFGTIRKVTKENPMLEEPIIDKNGGIEDWLGGHMVWATGYCVKNGLRCIRCRNSWGSEWGENGDFYIPESYFTWSQRKGFPIPSVEPWAFEMGTVSEPQQTGWYKQDEKWRYTKDGKDATGWLLDRGTWYYLDPDGFMAAEVWRFIDNCWYYLTSSGAMARGWRLIGGKWYYFRPGTDKLGPNGSMVTGWISLDGKHYFLNDDPDGPIPFGAMVLTDSSGAVIEKYKG